MSDAKKRPITIKQWLHYSSTRSAASAIGFLTKYREFLRSSEVSHIAAPILAQVDAGTLLPTPALVILKDALNTYQNNKALAEVEAKLAKASETKEEKPSKTWQATVYDSKGNVIQATNKEGKLVDLDMSFKLNQEATGWVDRRLFNCEPNSYAVITHTPTNAIETIQRGDAIARIMRSKKAPAARAGSKSAGSLSWGSKASQTRVTFSAG